MNWYDIEPKDALDIDFRTRPDLNPPVNEMGEVRPCLECDGHGQEYIGGTWSYCIRCDGAGYDCYGPESYTTNKTVIYGQ